MGQQRLTHESSRVGLIGANLVVNGDEALLDDKGDLATGKGVLKTVAKEDLRARRSVSSSYPSEAWSPLFLPNAHPASPRRSLLFQPSVAIKAHLRRGEGTPSACGDQGKDLFFDGVSYDALDVARAV